ncbi:MAG TPA: APC family permease [Actinomycetota bacterium]
MSIAARPPFGLGRTESAPKPTPSPGYAFKRLLLGRPLATARLEHERLGKPTALAVFSSDNMSSVAYATEEILRVLIPVVGIAAFTLVMPITIAVVVVEAILIFSYRQTIKAYPSAGGAYIVTKDNLGLLPAQLAGVALLVDYVLTVSVSTAAGVQAISSVHPLAVPVRIGLSLFFVWLIAYGNLLGVRESGRIFAAPTYLFIFSLGLTCAMGLYQVILGHLRPFPIQHQVATGGLSPGVAAVGMFIVLRAFASGGAAVTGVEAISNGVPAFRKPEWKNARDSLTYMGVILCTSFLAVSYLAHRLHVVPVADESKSLLGQIAQAVYGRGALGHTLFLVLQLSTTLILVLAANTSFADFPRLASFHAHDAFMPRQLTKRGHRLVFSNGIVALAGAASLVIVVFGASVTRMIPLYALGVFTSFTLSQSGMAKRHLRLREEGWRHGLFFNGLGAVTTFVVTIVIAIEKFTKGAWIVVVFVPLMVFLLVRVNRTYEAEEEDLLEGLGRIGRQVPKRHRVVVFVDALDEKTYHALQYALTAAPQTLRAVHLDSDPAATAALKDAWNATRLRFPLDVVPCQDGDRAGCLERYVRSQCSRDAETTVILPGSANAGLWRRLRQGRTLARLLDSMRDIDTVSVAVVRDHGGTGHTVREGRLWLWPRGRHVVLILVDRLDRSVLKAIRYARAIEATDIIALHAAVDLERAQELLEQWGEAGTELGVPLEVDECADRNIARTVSEAAGRLSRKDTEVTVVIPRREYGGRTQRFLHDHTSRSISRALADQPHVDVVTVPYRLGAPHAPSEARSADVPTR